jgi:E3 ubiquitin-protein ligase MYCBP2
MRLKCGHAIHERCALAQYRVAQDHSRIIFPRCGFPGCPEIPEHPRLAGVAAPWILLRAGIEAIARRVVSAEHLENDAHVMNPASEYFGNPMKFAREKLAFCMCARCRAPYYAGHVECGEEEGERRPDEYACRACSRVFEKEGTCPKHGESAMIFKCFWCCKPAAWFCWGTTHFCAACHERPVQVVKPPWPECDGHCQFHPHAPNGTKQILGFCRICEEERMVARGRVAEVEVPSV